MPLPPLQSAEEPAIRAWLGYPAQSFRPGYVGRLRLLSLPLELLTMIVHQLYSLGDLISLSMTCRHLHDICAEANPALRPVFHQFYSEYHRPPYLQLLVVAVARPLADWAIQFEANRDQLYEYLLDGHDGLLDLAEEVTRLHLHDIRSLFSQKQDLLDPVSQRLEESCGMETYYSEVVTDVSESEDATEDDRQSEDDRRSEANHDGIHNDLVWSPKTALLNFWIYCELFHHHVDYALAGPTKAKCMPKILSMKTRERFVAYCIPDYINKLRRPDWTKERQIMDQRAMWYSDFIINLEDRLTTVLDRRSAIPWDIHRLNLFLMVLTHKGEQTLTMMLPGGVEAAVSVVEEVMDRVWELDDEEFAESLDPDWFHGMLGDIRVAIYSYED